jgi:hypothetical protein
LDRSEYLGIGEYISLVKGGAAVRKTYGTVSAGDTAGTHPTES